MPPPDPKHWHHMPHVPAPGTALGAMVVVDAQGRICIAPSP